MKFGSCFLDRLARIVTALILLAFIGFALLAACFALQDDLREWWAPLLAALLMAVFLFSSLWEMAPTRLHPEGITVCFFGFHRTFPWFTIRQTVILEPITVNDLRTVPYTVVLVTAKGHPMTPDALPVWFLLRNSFRLIRIPCTAESVAYVRTYCTAPELDRRCRRKEAP